jgi:glycine cleavage system transcriptional repressor
VSTISISVTGKDQAGIIAALSGAIFQSGGNLEDASMTILEGEFAMIFIASLKDEMQLKRVKVKLEALKKRYSLSVTVKKIQRTLERGEKHQPGTEAWILSVIGKDRAGMVYEICKLLAAKNLNITDLNSKILGDGDTAAYALILEVDIATDAKAKKEVTKGLQALEKKLSAKITFKPLEVAAL